VLELALDDSGRQASRVEAQHGFIKAVKTVLMFRHQDRLKMTLTSSCISGVRSSVSGCGNLVG